jgi:hypothetical protein
LFGPLKQHLKGRRFHSNEEVEMAVRKWLRVQQPGFYGDGIFKVVLRRDRFIILLGDYDEK